MTTELLPCPFCGGKAEVERSQERFEYSINGGPDSVMDYGYYVYCMKCDASVGLINVPPNDRDVAIANWNRRADAPHLDWDKAKAHLEHYAQIYSDLPTGRFGLAITIMPLQGRLEKGERTQWLYDEIMEVN